MAQNHTRYDVLQGPRLSSFGALGILGLKALWSQTWAFRWSVVKASIGASISMNTFIHFFGGFLVIVLYNGPQNPILIIKVLTSAAETGKPDLTP